MWAYFSLELGWLKTNAGTNIGPQDNMYLSAALICHKSPFGEMRMKYLTKFILI